MHIERTKQTKILFTLNADAQIGITKKEEVMPPRVGIGTSFFQLLHTYNSPTTTSEKFAFADDLAIFHSTKNWKALEQVLYQNISTLSTYF